MNDISFITNFDLSLIIKIPFLMVIVLYILFALILLNKVRSLGKIIFVEHFRITLLLNSIAFIHLLFAVSLFFITLVIL